MAQFLDEGNLQACSEGQKSSKPISDRVFITENLIKEY